MTITLAIYLGALIWVVSYYTFRGINIEKESAWIYAILVTDLYVFLMIFYFIYR